MRKLPVRNYQHFVVRRLRRNVVLSRLSGYVRGEQSPDARRETSRLIDGDDGIFRDFVRERDADRATRAELAPHGRPDRAQLERSFAQIGAALNGRAPLYTLRHQTDWRARAAALMMGALLLIPVAIGVNRVAALGIATQPQPRAIIVENITPTGETPDTPVETLTPKLVTALFVARATPAAPETE